MTAFTDNSQFLEGVETVAFRVVDSASPFNVANTLCGELNHKQLQTLSTIQFEGQALSIELDKAELDKVGAPAPINGSRIERTNTDNSKWRVLSKVYDHVIGVYRCICGEIR